MKDTNLNKVKIGSNNQASTEADFSAKVIKLEPITTAQRDAISAEDGMITFSNNLDTLEVYAGGSWSAHGGFCGVSLSFVSILGTPQVTLTPPTTITAVNPDGAPFSIGIYYQDTPYTTTSGEVVHMEQYLDAESPASASNGMVMAYSENPTGSVGRTISGYNLRINSGAGAGAGILLDIITGAPVLTNMTIPNDGSYVAALDLDHTAKTCAFKDNQGRSGALTTKASSWESSPVYIAATSLAGGVLGDSVQTTWNPGTQSNQLPTTGSIRPCEAS